MHAFNLLRLTQPLLLSVTRRILSSSSIMAKSKFEYVRNFEEDNKCLLNCWIVVRLDGKGFHRFTDNHNFSKPNDVRGLKLMSRAASCVMDEFKDVSIAFGHSDEYSFVLKKNSSVFNRRREKIVSLVTSIFSSSYVFYWKDYFPDEALKCPPCFDARIILYPTDQNLRDYMSWRQADVHVNNLYNTCFWALVLKKKLTPQEAEEKLRGTVSSDKNELLFQEFGINYNTEDPMFRKGTTLVRKLLPINGQSISVIIPLYEDIIKDKFWKEHSELLSLGKTQLYEKESESEEVEYLLNKKLNF